ncbi:UTRA domain-containing protein [Nonomuraea longicatena]|uniref:UbiC transcription regulator-associated domain-containing protein n=1 Tax=Nonomuraea longicatena TaxID=83682 RepID=A0ABN1NV74_9ACTN
MTDTGWGSVSASYVRPRRPGEPEAWAEEAAQHGRVGTQKLRAVEEVNPPQVVAEAFGLGSRDRAVVRRRLILMDGRPTELADSYYPATVARGTRLTEARRIAGGALAVLADLGYQPAGAEEGVIARPSTPAEQELLDIRPQDWVMVLTRVLRTGDGVPIEVSVMTMVAEGRELRYKTTIQ